MNRKQQRQKALERLHVEKFQKLMGWSHELESLEEGKGPDFLLRSADDVIGLEVTEVFKDAGAHGSRLKATERKRDDFLQDVATHYYREDGPPILVQANFNRMPNAEDVSVVSRFVRRLRSTTPMDQNRAEAPDDLGIVYVTSLPDEFSGYRHWQCVNNSFSIGDHRLTSDFLQATINKKGKKLGRYCEGVITSKTVLLIVADVFWNSSRLRLPEVPIEVSPAGFSEIYVLQGPEAACRIA